MVEYGSGHRGRVVGKTVLSGILRLVQQVPTPSILGTRLKSMKEVRIISFRETTMGN